LSNASVTRNPTARGERITVFALQSRSHRARGVGRRRRDPRSSTRERLPNPKRKASLERHGRRLGRALLGIGPTERKISGGVLAELARRLVALSPDAVAGLELDPARRDTIGTGAIVFDTIVRQLGSPQIYFAKAALREGALLSLARPIRDREKMSRVMLNRFVDA
jgi:hypothetical protein